MHGLVSQRLILRCTQAPVKTKGAKLSSILKRFGASFYRRAHRRIFPTFPSIVAFRGEKEYKPYRINEFALAFYTGNQDRDYIVMQDISSEHYPAAIHEYAHLIINHSG